MNYVPSLYVSDFVPTDVFHRRPDGCTNIRLHAQYVESVHIINQEHPALIFIRENQSQVQQKANKYGIDVADVGQDICLIFLEKAPNFDSSRGTLQSYIFGHLEKVLRRQNIGPLRFALSLDDDGERALIIREQVESAAMVEADDALVCSGRFTAPGQISLEAIAEIISGKSSMEVAAERGLSKRRVNQILKKVREEASVQFDLEFAKGSK